MRRRALPLAALALLLMGVGVGCDRNIEPYDPDERVEQPDLSKIFPEGATRAEGDSGMPGAPGGGAPPAAPAADRGSDSDAAPLRGTIRLSEELADRVPPGAILFLIARTGPAGPPTAVKRVADPRFPLDFELGPGDRMIQSLPFAGPFRLTARIDADRNAMTRNPGDLAGEAEGFHAPGADGIELVIDEIL